MIYCDTSLLVAALTPEARSPEMRDWLGAHAAGELCISPWTNTEFSAALALKVRHRTLTAELRLEALAQWRVMQVDQLAVVPVSAEAYDLASSYCDMVASRLRAADALHLAVAALGGHALATLDARLAEGAQAVGVRVVHLRAFRRVLRNELPNSFVHFEHTSIF